MIARVLALAAAVASTGCERRGDRLDLAAAASLRHALPALIDAFEQTGSGTRINVRYGPSGELAALARDGIAFDGVILADARSVESLVGADKVARDATITVAHNSIVLVSRDKIADLRFETLDRVPDGIAVAIGDPATVPMGRYAKAYLLALDKWQAFQSSALLGGDAAAVLAMVERGDVAAAIVYATDAAAARSLVVLDRADPARSPLPSVVAAPIRGADGNPGEFFAFLLSPRGQEILRAHGFAPR